MESIKKDILCCFFFRPALVVCKTVCFHLPVASVSCLFYFSIWFLLLLFLLLLPAATLLSLLWPLLLCFGFFFFIFTFARFFFARSHVFIYLYLACFFFFGTHPKAGTKTTEKRMTFPFSPKLCVFE